MDIPELLMDDFRYALPEERIARYPLPVRDASKLLVWRDGRIGHRVFHELPELLSGKETLFFNNTRVIPARLFFRRPTGARIEVFLLQPQAPAIVDRAMQAFGPQTWVCAIGNLKRWPEDLALEETLALEDRVITLRATLLDRPGMIVRLEWSDPVLPLVRILELAGAMPIPPYLQRPAEETDRTAYQTVYGRRAGAVAAPTAGLHFTPELLERLREKGIQTEELTLHVSAGTFLPVKTALATAHTMHAEQVVVRRSNLEPLLTGRPVAAVGTTALRTLESLYWFGVKLLRGEGEEFDVEQFYPYTVPAHDLPDRTRAIEAVAGYMDRGGLHELYGETHIYILPGYLFRTVDALITNFHQPGSTLLLLVAAFTGGGAAWQEIYRAALENDYRFLSYGDSSLLFRY